MFYYQVPLSIEEYKYAISEPFTNEKIVEANRQLQGWSSTCPVQIESIIAAKDRPSIEKIVLFRQIKMILSLSKFILDVHNRNKSKKSYFFGSSMLYDILIMDRKKIPNIILELEEYRLDRYKMGLEEWSLSREGGSRVLREKVVVGCVDYLNIEINGTKYVINKK